jgi:hypothetical protein
MVLPGDVGLQTGGKRILMKNQRIPHKKILQALQGPADSPDNIVSIYRDRVLTVKTRTIQLLGRKGPARVMETLLGYEVQASYKRLQCPDEVTARYLRLFTEIGCHSIRLPYDPTHTATLIRDLECAVETIRREITKLFPTAPQMGDYVLRRVYGHLRSQLKSH